MIVPYSLPGFFILQGKRAQLCTKSLAPGKPEFDEVLVRERGEEFRVLDPMRSKLGAALVKGLKDPGLRPGDVVLYLGASHGYTPSFVSDIVGESGLLLALDVAPRVVRDLVFLAGRRRNIAPILADAAHPASFCDRVCQADWLYQDVAQKDQVGIFLDNVRWFLKPGGLACLAVKARSIDITKRDREVFAKVRQSLEKAVTIVECVELDPLQKGHCFFVVRNEPPMPVLDPARSALSSASSASPSVPRPARPPPQRPRPAASSAVKPASPRPSARPAPPAKASPKPMAPKQKAKITISDL